jgi:acylphosphatase
MPMLRKHIIVHGHVHGVGFRYFAMRAAQAAGVTGWVRNTWDGGVEVEAQGDKAAMLLFTDALRHGPGYANVDSLDIKNVSAVAGEASFSVRM